MRLPTPPGIRSGVGSSLPSSLRNNRRTKVSSAGSRWRDDETPLVARYLAWGGRTCIRVLPAASFSYWCLACGSERDRYPAMPCRISPDRTSRVLACKGGRPAPESAAPSLGPHRDALRERTPSIAKRRRRSRRTRERRRRLHWAGPEHPAGFSFSWRARARRQMEFLERRSQTEAPERRWWPERIEGLPPRRGQILPWCSPR